MTTQERFARRRKKLEEKLTRLDLQEARTLQREQAHDEQIARDLAGVPGHFAHGLNFYKLFWVFFLCCFLGVVIETIFCWIASGRLSQRTGLVWGPFNLIYGIGAVLDSKSIDLVMHMERWVDGKEYDRLGLNEEYITILGVKVPHQIMPVRPGRNLAIIIEVAARNLSLKRTGYSAAHELDRRLNDMIMKQSGQNS